MSTSAVLDVVIGMVFCYASVALVASYLYETGASILGLRAQTLLAGVKAMLNDTSLQGLGLAVYNHALVNPRHDGKTEPGQKPKVLPSYIDSKAFAIALVDAVQALPGQADDMEAKIRSLPDTQLRQLLLGMYERSQKDIGELRARISGWYDVTMCRVSGVYKRRSQLFTFLLALALSVALNIDTFRVFRSLWAHPALLAQLSNQGGSHPPAQTVALLSALPIGWNVTLEPLTLLGWLFTASTALFGAPTWFGLLNRLSNMRGAGGAEADFLERVQEKPATNVTA